MSMIVNIKNFKIEDNELNRVKSDKIFKPRRCKDKNGDWRFHEEGIFSREIFGSLYTCLCKETDEIGTWCPKCGTRVVSKSLMPDYYINCGVDAPHIKADYSVFGKDLGSKVESLMTYNSFMYNGEIIEFDLYTLDLEAYDLSKILIGKEAVLSLGVDEEWYNDNTIRNIPVPHPIYRPIINTNNKSKFVLGEINEILIDLLGDINKIESFKCLDDQSVFDELSLSRLLCNKYFKFMESLFNLITSGKKSTIKSEIICQSLTGAARAVLTNDDDLNEDDIMIGKEIVETLFPNVYRDCRIYEYNEETGKKRFTGQVDIDLLNQKLKEGNYKVIINRPPTIGQLSIMAMNPIVSKNDNRRFILGTNSIIYDGMAADTDGDCLLVVALYSEEACKEAERLLPSNNYIGGALGTIRNRIPEDFIFAMRQIYKYNEEITKEIKSTIYGEDFININSTFEEDLEFMEEIPRNRYINVYKILADNMWKYCDMPTVGDLVDFMQGEQNEKMDDITEFLDNREKLEELLNKESAVYSNTDSKKFIDKVISANVTDVAMAGYFYKKLMASTDDIRITEESCESKGIEIAISDLTEEEYAHKVRFLYVEELGDYAKQTYKQFMNSIKTEIIHVRSPLHCDFASERKLCPKCAGVIRRTIDDCYIPENIGIFTTLMITEHATQGALSSMNNGLSKNMNEILESKIGNGKKMTWDEVKENINNIIAEVGNIGVQTRFYEIALMSRVYKKGTHYASSAFQYSLTHQNDPLATFVYMPSSKNFKKLINTDEFEASSIKSQIMFDKYE